MKRILIITFLYLGIVSSLFAQEDTVEHVTKYPILIPKIDVANAANPEDPSWIFALEFFPFIKWLSLSQEVGFVSDIREDETATLVSSLKYRRELRLYSPTFGSGYYDFATYVGGSYQRRDLTINDNYIIGYECEGDDCVYYQNYEGDISTTRKVYQVHVGIQMRADRFVLEGDLGAGESRFTVDRSPFFEESSFVEKERFLSEANLGKKTYVNFRLKVGYMLWRR